MKRPHFLVFFLLSATYASSAAADGPFGVEMGSPVSLLKNCSASVANQVKCSELPKPHPSFESYQLIYTEKDGICSIIAIGKDMYDQGAAYTIRGSADEMAGFLNKAYGPSRHSDEIDKDSQFKQLNEWMLAFSKKQRTYQYVWPEKLESKLKNNISKIVLKLQPLGSNFSYLTLRYDFTNYAACQRTIRERAADNL